MSALVSTLREGIVLHQFGERGGELHLVLAVFEAEPDGEHRHWSGRPLGLHGPALFGADRLPRPDAVEPAQRHRVAGAASPALDGLLAAQGEDTGRTLIAAVGADDDRAIAELPRQDARQRELAAVRGMQRLHHVGRRPGVLELQPARRHLDRRRLMAQRLEQAEDAVVVARRAEQHRTDQAVAKLLRQVLEDPVARRWQVGKELLHKLVVVVGELLQHMEARFLLALADRLGSSTISEGAPVR